MITALCQDGQGRVWAGSERGRVGWWEEEGLAALEEALPGLRVLWADAQGEVWLGRLGHAPALYGYGGGRLRELSPQSASFYYVYALCAGMDGTLWIGTGIGLFSLREGVWSHFTVEDGLPENTILALGVEPGGALWIGTSGGGAVRYWGQGFQVVRLGNTPARNIVEALLVDGRGRVWLGTREGLLRYAPGLVAPQVYIRRVVAGRSFTGPEVVECSESIPEIRVVYQGIGFRTGARHLLYSHRLLGGEQEGWSEFSGAREKVYRGLDAGAYRFEVRARDRDGRCSKEAGFELHLVPERAADPIISYIRLHCSEIGSRAGVCAHFGLSPSTLSRRVRQAVGQSFVSFLHRCKVEKAQRMLRRRELRIAAVAAAVGFSSPEHFSRIFHAVVGESPRAYQQRVRA